MWDGDPEQLRMQYLFALAKVCNVTPEASWRLKLLEFAVLLRDIDAYIAAQNAPAPGE